PDADRAAIPRGDRRAAPQGRSKAERPRGRPPAARSLPAPLSDVDAATPSLGQAFATEAPERRTTQVAVVPWTRSVNRTIPNVMPWSRSRFGRSVGRDSASATDTAPRSPAQNRTWSHGSGIGLRRDPLDAFDSVRHLPIQATSCEAPPRSR